MSSIAIRRSFFVLSLFYQLKGNLTHALSIFLGTHLSNLCYIIHLDLVCEKRFVVNILRTFESTLKTLDTKFKCLRIDSECFLFICLVEDFKYPTGSDSGCIMTKPPGLGWV